MEGFPDGITSYDQLPFSTLRTRIAYYGYNYIGTEEADGQNIDAYFDGTTRAGFQEPRRLPAPLLRGLYPGQDRVPGPHHPARPPRRRLRQQHAGPEGHLRADPIQRADDIGTVPVGIESDYAVYYNGDMVVGYRDTDGNFYDAEGVDVAPDVVISDNRGQVLSVDAPRSSAFEEYKPQATVMPRVGVSFPVTDRALFFASYNVTSQRPTEQAFAPTLHLRRTRRADAHVEPDAGAGADDAVRARLPPASR